MDWMDARPARTEEHNGKFKVGVGGETETLHRPSGKDIGEQMVVDLRRMLGAAGITAEGLRERRDVSAEPAATEPSGHAILVISYHGADIYPTDATNGAPRRIVPEDPRGRLRTMHHEADNPRAGTAGSRNHGAPSWPRRSGLRPRY
jgi:hypothetical protein